MRKGFLMYEEKRKYLVIYEKAVIVTYDCATAPSDFLIREENLVFFFISVTEAENSSRPRKIFKFSVYGSGSWRVEAMQGWE